MQNRKINVGYFGAVGDGVRDDVAALQFALNEAARMNGSLYFPAGVYRCSKPLVLAKSKARLNIHGDGANVSILRAPMELGFEQEGATQPYGVTIRDMGFRAIGNCGTALRISYGQPEQTNDHNRPSVSLRDIVVESGIQGSWANGIEVEGAWNPTFDNVFVSGDSAGGIWNNMRGAGITLKGMCVNAVFEKCRMNFWAEGFLCHSNGKYNTEGLQFSNCNMVGVKRGVWVSGNPDIVSAPRISSFIWHGGIIDARVGGVIGGSAAFHLEHVWTVLINGCQMIPETVDGAAELTYGVVLENCRGAVIQGNDINGWKIGTATTGRCIGVAVRDNTYTNTRVPVQFSKESERTEFFGAIYADAV